MLLTRVGLTISNDQIFMLKIKILKIEQLAFSDLAIKIIYPPPQVDYKTL
jgi:hypothetical protein